MVDSVSKNILNRLESAVEMFCQNKHNIKSKFPPKEPHQIVQYNKSFKLKPSMGYS